jgi:hypothetical protein
MIAGHLLLTLLGNNGPSIRHTLQTVLITAQITVHITAQITAQIIPLILETAVAIIQSYVFAVLCKTISGSYQYQNGFVCLQCKICTGAQLFKTDTARVNHNFQSSHATERKVKKIKCTLVQALRLCTGRTAYRRSRGIALPFNDHGTGRV